MRRTLKTAMLITAQYKLKCHYDVNFTSLFTSAFESGSDKYLPRQILHRNSNGKISYFKREVQLRLAAITRFEKWP